MEGARYLSVGAHVLLVVAMVVWVSMQRDVCTMRMNNNPPREDLRYTVDFVTNGAFVMCVTIVSLVCTLLPPVRIVRDDEGGGTGCIAVYTTGALGMIAWPLEHVLRGTQALTMLSLTSNARMTIEIIWFVILAAQIHVVFKFSIFVADQEDDRRVRDDNGTARLEDDAADAGKARAMRIGACPARDLKLSMAIYAVAANLAAPIFAARSVALDAPANGRIGTTLTAATAALFAANVVLGVASLTWSRETTLPVRLHTASILAECALQSMFVADSLACY